MQLVEKYVQSPHPAFWPKYTDIYRLNLLNSSGGIYKKLKSFAAHVHKVPVQASDSPLPSCCVQERASKDRQYVDSQHNAGHSNVGNRNGPGAIVLPSSAQPHTLKATAAV